MIEEKQKTLETATIEKLTGWDSLGVPIWRYVDITEDDGDLDANDWLTMAVLAVNVAEVTQ